MKKYIFVFSCMCVFSACALFERERATVHAQKGEWTQANELLQPLVVGQHDNPALLYDAGVTSLKAGNTVQAAAYFEHAAAHKNSSSQLKERAYFNAGNAAVALEDLKKAITQYEQVLKINPDNEYAKHNLERVKQMLQEQQENEQQQEQQQNKDQNKDSKKDKKQQDEKNGQQQQGDGAQDKKNGSDGNQSDDGQQQGDQQKGDGDTDDGNSGQGNEKKQSKDKSQQGEQEHDNAGADQNDAGDESPKEKDTQKGKQSGQDGKKDKQRNQNNSQGNGDSEQDLNDESKNADNGGKQTDKQGKHTNSSKNDMRNENNDTQEAEKSQDATGEQPEFNPEDQWIAQLLDERNESDGTYTKQLTKIQVDKNLAGKHGQNCW